MSHKVDKQSFEGYHCRDHPRPYCRLKLTVRNFPFFIQVQNVATSILFQRPVPTAQQHEKYLSSTSPMPSAGSTSPASCIFACSPSKSSRDQPTSTKGHTSARILGASVIPDRENLLSFLSFSNHISLVTGRSFQMFRNIAFGIEGTGMLIAIPWVLNVAGSCLPELPPSLTSL